MIIREPILRITDGYTTYNLINKERHGISLFDWTPAVSASKDGGVWANSPLMDGRQLVYRKLDNVVETFSLRIGAESQDMAITMLTQLTNLLEAGVGYWTSGSRMSIPTWIEAKGPDESNTRYALIYDYKIPELDNPFATPFFNTRRGVSLDEITLIIERGQWQETPIGESVCAQYSAFQRDTPVMFRRTITNGIYDSYAYSGSVNSILPWVRAGRVGSNYYVSAYKFINVPIDNGLRIERAVMKVALIDTYGSSTVRLRVRGSRETNITGTYAQFNATTRTDAFEILKVQQTDEYGKIFEIDVTAIVQEIVNRAAWVSLDDLDIFIEGYSGTKGGGVTDYHWADFNTADAPSLTSTSLEIMWLEDRGVVTPSCTDGYISNQYTQIQITHVFRYDDSAGTYSANQLTTASYDLLPDPPAVGDILYIGVKSDPYYGYFAPFCNAIFNLSTENISYGGGVGITGVWEYYDTSPAWVSLDVTDRTIEKGDPAFTGDTFSRVGVCGIFFNQARKMAASWGPSAVNGVDAFWIRFRVTAVSSPITPVQTGLLYCVTWPNVRIMGSQVPGDIPALASLTLTGESYYDGDYGTSNLQHAVSRVYVSAWPYIDTVDESIEYWNTGWKDQRSMFQPYLPTNDYIRPPGTVHDIEYGTNTNNSNYIPATSGYCARYTPSGAAAESMLARVTYYLDTDVFRGTFRVFVRASQLTGSANKFNIIVSAKYGALTQETKVGTVKKIYSSDEPNWNLIELGDLTIPPFADKLSRTDYVNDLYCKLIIGAEYLGGATSPDLYINDVILMPTDSFMGVFTTINENIYNLMAGRSLEIDSVHSQYAPIRAVSRETYYDNTINSFWEEINNGPFVLTQNRVTKLFVLAANFDNADSVYISYPSICFGVKVNKSSRYLGMRGNK